MALYAEPYIKGFTTNPTLMRKGRHQGLRGHSGRKDSILRFPDRPISLEVFADDFASMEKQPASLRAGQQCNVKIPVTDTKGNFSGELIRRLSAMALLLNVTAILSLPQVTRVAEALDSQNTGAIVSVFAGRRCPIRASIRYR